MHIKPEIERFAKIRVVGIGGAGCNVINTMIESQQINGVEFIAVNTDAQDLSINKAFIKLPIGQELTNGLGAGANPEVGRKAAEEDIDLIKSNLEGADMVFVTAGMGGGTGTGAAPVVARVAREMGALTIGVVTKPFAFEGARRMQNAELGIEELSKEVDAIITIPNQRLLEVTDEKMSVLEAFRLSDSVLNQGVQGISDLIVMPGHINVDFADVKTIMQNAGSALMGIGIGTGEDRAAIAARAAITSPLLDISIDGATGILFNVLGGEDTSMREVDEAAKIIIDAASPDANIIFGQSIDETMTDQIKITVIATGFDTDDIRSKLGISRDDSYATAARDDSFRQDSFGATTAPAEITAPAVPVDVTTPVESASTEDEDDDLPEDDDGKKDSWGSPNLGDDPESKYDIPAFLRGR